MVAFVAMTSDTLDLSQSNATCRVYHEYGETSVFFRHVNMDKASTVNPRKYFFSGKNVII